MKKQFAALALASALITITGCSHADTPATPECLRPDADGLGVVVATHQGAVSGLGRLGRCALGEALLRGLPVSIVAAQGQPQVVVKGAAVNGTFNSDLARKAAVVEAGNAVATAAANAVPSSDGNDLVAALRMVSDLVRASGAQRPQIISNDPGLTDTGALKVTQAGMLVANAGEVAADVSGAGHCPVDAGTHVDFIGLGYGVAPQPLLTPSDRLQVTALWSALVTTCGGTVAVHPEPATGEGPTTPHTVVMVTPTPYQEPVVDDPIVLAGESAFGFDHDETEFKNPAEAAKVLEAVVATLNAHPTWHLRIEGTTANGYTAYPSLEALGQARADAVKAALVARRVDPGRLVAVGHGYIAEPVQVDATTSALNRRTILTYFRP